MTGGQLEVAVTQEDIDQGARKDSSRCVVATAIAHSVPKAARITVDVHSIKFTVGARRYTYLTPPKVMDYIVAFDAGDDLHPFKFRLRADQRLVQQRRVSTPDGKTIHSAETKTRRRRAKLETVAADPAASPAQVEVASDEYAAAAADLAAKKAAAGAAVPPGQTRPRYSAPLRPMDDVSDVPPSQVKKLATGRATVFYRNKREYGARVMRVNKLDDRPGDFRGPLDVDVEE